MGRTALVRASGCSSFLLVCLLSAAPATAQATRTWVSGVGDDANPCSRTAPCKTFAGAISKTATAGEINVLDPGGFGAVTITKSITISSEGFEAGVLASGTNAIIVNAPASAVVVLRGLDIEGLGSGLNGIRFIAGGSLHVERCTINNFSQMGIDFQPSGASELFVSDTIIRNTQPVASTVGGLLVKPTATGSARATITRTQFLNNHFGMRVEGGSKVSVTDSVASGNNTNGFVAVGTAVGSAELSIESSTASNNTLGGVRADQVGATVFISNMSISGNGGNGLSINGAGAIVSFGNNSVAGNGVNGSPTSTVPQI